MPPEKEQWKNPLMDINHPSFFSTVLHEGRSQNECLLKVLRRNINLT